MRHLINQRCIVFKFFPRFLSRNLERNCLGKHFSFVGPPNSTKLSFISSIHKCISDTRIPTTIKQRDYFTHTWELDWSTTKIWKCSRLARNPPASGTISWLGMGKKTRWSRRKEHESIVAGWRKRWKARGRSTLVNNVVKPWGARKKRDNAESFFLEA